MLDGFPISPVRKHLPSGREMHPTSSSSTHHTFPQPLLHFKSNVINLSCDTNHIFYSAFERLFSKHEEQANHILALYHDDKNVPYGSYQAILLSKRYA